MPNGSVFQDMINGGGGMWLPSSATRQLQIGFVLWAMSYVRGKLPSARPAFCCQAAPIPFKFLPSVGSLFMPLPLPLRNLEDRQKRAH